MKLKLIQFDTINWAEFLTPNINKWWGLPFEWKYVRSTSPVEMRSWGEHLARMDEPMIERWKDKDFDLTVLCAPYQKPKNFLGLYLSLIASVRGLYDPTNKVIEVFAGENESSYFGDKKLGSTFELYLNHEISHYFYDRIGLPDKTHEFFYNGLPELARAEILSKLPLEESPREWLLRAAKKSLGENFADKAPEDRACAEAVSKILQKVIPFPTILHTGKLNEYLKKDNRFKATLEPLPGNVIVSPTTTTVGHAGIFLENQKIASNNSNTGLFGENYTLDSWAKEMRINRGLYIHFYQLI